MKFLLFILFTIALGAEEDENEVRKPLFEMEISQGKLRGFKEESLGGREIYSFLGIPFAKPPTGQLRFEDPLPAESWTGTLEADKSQEVCTQFDMLELLKNNFEIVGSEDCLYLNVHTPRPNKLDAKLPVMVFVHGGGLSCGSSKEYQPYVLLDEDIVLVVIQYRLSILGFLSSGDSSMGGNYGLKDMVMSLKWVQKNVQQFGGDPERVTIFGESAGGLSVHLLMLSPMSEGLFHGVIAQSGVAGLPWSVLRDAKKYAQKYGEAVGCPLEEDGISFKACLRQKDAKELLQVNLQLFEWAQAPVFTLPRVDGHFLPDEPLVLIKEKKYNKVNFISGVTRDEGIIFSIWHSAPDLLEPLLSDFDRIAPYALMVNDEPNSAAIARKIFDHYLEGKKLTNVTMIGLEDMYTDRFFTVGHDIVTKLHSEDPKVKTFRYLFDYKGQLSFLSAFMNITGFDDEVSHGDDLFYLFSGGPILTTPLETHEDLKMRKIFVKLWTNFAATGDPTPDDSLGFRWTPATPSEFHQAVLTPKPSMSEYVNTKARDFFDSLPLTENYILRGSDRHHSQREREEL